MTAGAMSHGDFIEGWKAGRLEVDVDRPLALQVANSKMLPGRYRAAHAFWSWVWILSIPAAFAVMFLFRWWAGLLMLVFLTPGLSKSTKKSAMQFMIDHALEDEQFYLLALKEGIIKVRVSQ